ncbi:MAG: hypothetical protein K0B87_07150 [Candidatus Syntrophosphaera sp.]|nr:hypothetical protein [Candidatus Syntrophosphaera sp.]
MKIPKLLPLLPLLLLGSCLLKPYVPVPDPAYGVENRFAIVQVGDLTIYVRAQPYSGEAQPVSSNFFTLYLRVRNNSSLPVTLDRNSFSVIAAQQQYDHIPLQLVLGSIGASYRFSQLDDPFATPFSEAQDQYWIKAQEQYFELMHNYFSFGEVLPGGIKEGYLFYNDRIARQSSFFFDALGTQVFFSR